MAYRVHRSARRGDHGDVRVLVLGIALVVTAVVLMWVGR